MSSNMSIVLDLILFYQVRNMKSFILLFVLFGMALTQGCPSFNANDLLQSGKHAFVISQFRGNPVRNYETPIFYTIPASGIQVAVSTSTIAGYNSLGGFNYHVSGKRKDQTNNLLITLNIQNGVQWNSIQVSYFVSSRNDFTVGHAIVEDFIWNYQNDGTVLATVDVPSTNIASNQQYDVAVFFSGLDSDAKGFSLRLLDDSYVNNTEKTLTIHFQPRETFYEIHFSYVIYLKTHPIFTIVKDNSPSGDGAYQIAGPKAFARNRLQYYEFKIENRFIFCEGEECPSKCILSDDCEGAGGNLYQNKCYFCPTGTRFQAGVCRSNCGENEIWFMNRICTCKQGYTKVNGVCSPPCGQYQSYQGGVCVCDPGYARYQGFCQLCPSGSAPNTDQTSCVCTQDIAYYDGQNNVCTSCPARSFPNADRNGCQCILFHEYDADGECQPNCPQNEEYSQSTQNCQCIPSHQREDGVCVSKCSSNEIYQSDTCVCNTGYIKHNGVCRLCPPNSFPNAQQTDCVCQQSNDYYGSTENQCITCPENSTPVGAGCQCNQGYQFENQGCVSVCDPNSVWQSGECVCIAQYSLYGGACRECPANSVPNQDQTSCVCNQPTQIYEQDGNQCMICPVNSVPNADRTGCNCIPFHVEVDGVCTPNCGSNQIYSSSSATCECEEGYQLDSGACVSICDPNSVWQSGECVCIAQYSLYGGACRQCPANSVPNQDQTSCICNEPTHVYNADDNQCEVCPAKSNPNADRTGCDCIAFHQYVDGVCTPSCGVNELYSDANQQCECSFGFVSLGGACVNRCGVNQQWNGNQCECIAAHATIDGACRPCPPNSAPNSNKDFCICTFPNQIFNPSRRLCEDCPIYSSPNAGKTGCVCDQGYVAGDSGCVLQIVCPANSEVVGTECRCVNGYYEDGGVCIKQPICPQNSIWNQRRLRCDCTIPGEYLIGRSCRPCGANEIWDGDRCICDEGFNKIFGVCRTCDPNSSYNGFDCVCNQGYYGDRDLCEKCHESCGRCTGPDASQCETCADISYRFNNGFCTRNTPCPPGFYLEGSQCQKCTDYCNECQDLFTCDVCADGFQIQVQVIDEATNQQVSFCTEICGDGRRFEDQCDDGYNDPDPTAVDGCSNQCTVDAGWTCFGGSSAVPSTCLQLIPEDSVIQPTGAVALAGKVYQQIRMSNIPECARQFECARCHEILDVRVSESLVKAVGVKVSFVPNSKYQFVVEFDFGSAFVTSAFTFIVQINKNFGGDCFTESDLNQQIEWFIDPAKLILDDEQGILTLDQLQFQDTINELENNGN